MINDTIGSLTQASFVARIWRWRYDFVFAFICVAAFVWRFHALTHGGTTSGNDWATLLLVGHSMLGHPVDPVVGTYYPPVVPILITSLSSVFPVIALTQFLSAVLAIAPYAGTYLVLRRNLSTAVSLVVPLPLLLSGSVNVLMSFGGVSQLIANGFFAATLVVAGKLFQAPDRRRAALFGLGVFFVAGSSAEVFVQLIVALVCWVLIEFALGPVTFWKKFKASWRFFLVASAPLLLLARIYQFEVSSFGLSPVSSNSSIYTPSFNYNCVTPDDHHFWILISCTALVTLICVPFLKTGPLVPYLRASAAGLITAVVSVECVPQVRFSYLVPVMVCFGAAVTAELIRTGLKGRLGFAMFATLVGLYLGNTVFEYQSSNANLQRQVNFYSALSPTGLDIKTFDYLKHHTSADSLFAVSSVSPYLALAGNWIEGYVERKAFSEGHLQNLYYPIQKTQSQIVSSILAKFPSTTSLSLAHQEHINYIVVFSNWYHFNPIAVDSFLASHANLVVVSNRDVVVLRVPQP